MFGSRESIFGLRFEPRVSRMCSRNGDFLTVTYGTEVDNVWRQGFTNFPKILEPFQNFRCYKSDMKQVSC